MNILEFGEDFKYENVNKSVKENIIKSYKEYDIMKAAIEQLPRLDKKILDLLNNQIKNELQSSHIYRNMASWLDNEGWMGGFALFTQYANEELKHMELIYKYISEKNCLSITPTAEKVDTKFKDIRDLVSQSLEHEMQVTKNWNDIANAALAVKDNDTYTLAQGFVKEQREEEEKFRNILFKMDLDMPKYEIDELFQDGIVKSENQDIEKGGEGSRGGKVVGHTKSGKPIYDHGYNPKYQSNNYSSQDHKDIAEHHEKVSKKSIAHYGKETTHSKEHKEWSDAHNQFSKEKSEKDELSKAFEILEKAVGHKYFKREGTPGNYKYYYTEADYKAGKGSSSEPKEEETKKDSLEDSISTNSEGTHQFISPVSGRVVSESKKGESKEDFVKRIKSQTAEVDSKEKESRGGKVIGH